MPSVVLATHNAGKVREISHYLQPLGMQIVSLEHLGITPADETGVTFVENALLKARHACSASGLPALADDSGLSVAALQGAPGVFSARYGGEQGNDALNNQTLLDALRDTPTEQRHASFHCVLVYLRHPQDPVPIICQGVWHGMIALHPSGTQGFGYDPLFYLPQQRCTAAELTLAEKQRLSHRGQALRQLISALQHV